MIGTRAFVVVAVAVALFAAARPTAAYRGQLTERSVVVTVVSGDEMYIGKDRVAASGVVDEVAKRLEALPSEERVVYIKAAPEVAYGPIVKLIDALKARGIDRIGLVADKSKPEVGSGGGAPPRPRTMPKHEGVIVEVILDRRGQASYAVEGRKVSARSLTSALRDRLARARKKNVMILAPQAVAYAQVVRVIDSAKSAGATDIALEQTFVEEPAPN